MTQSNDTRPGLLFVNMLTSDDKLTLNGKPVRVIYKTGDSGRAWAALVPDDGKSVGSKRPDWSK